MLSQIDTHYTIDPQTGLKYWDEPEIEIIQQSDNKQIIEFAARICYDSHENKGAYSDTDNFLKTLLRAKHLSVFEHYFLTVYIRGISGFITHELVRHRHLSYSQISTRRVNFAKFMYVIPIELQSRKSEILQLIDRENKTLESFRPIIGRYSYSQFIERSPILVSGNLRGFMEMIEKRNQPNVDPNFRLLVKKIMENLYGTINFD